MQTPKYQQITDSIRNDVVGGVLRPGQKLPNDSELGGKFGASRLTVIRALRKLTEEGLVHRRAGSGTFVGRAAIKVPDEHTFGLLIPDLGEGEIFEPICQGMAQAGQSAHQALLWGNVSSQATDKRARAEELARYFIRRRVSGVFFAPLELASDKDEINHRIAAELESAAIPIVLLDRCYLEFPQRSRYDLVGIDNRRAGYLITEYLLAAGCKSPGFLVRPGSASTVKARIAGFQEAQYRRGTPVRPSQILETDLNDPQLLQSWVDAERLDGFVCANDYTAALAMQLLSRLNIRVPDDLRVVGFDDVRYAALLKVPLTTIKQPCLQIGAAAIDAMLQRLARPEMMPRDILLPFELVVRESCGEKQSSP